MAVQRRRRLGGDGYSIRRSRQTLQASAPAKRIVSQNSGSQATPHQYSGRRRVQDQSTPSGVTATIRQPSGYSPNLNLIERLWGHLKRKALSDLFFRTASRLLVAIHRAVTALNNAGNDFLRILFSTHFAPCRITRTA